MKKRFSNYLKPGLLRPILRKTLVRMVIAALLTVLWDRLVNTAGYFSTRTHVFSAFGAVFLFAAWLSFLRLDGFHPGSVRRKKPCSPEKGLSDVVQTDVDNDEELTPDERTFCALAASLACSIICWLIAIL